MQRAGAQARERRTHLLPVREIATPASPAICGMMTGSGRTACPPAATFRRRLPWTAAACSNCCIWSANILLHGHERLDTDSTPTLIGEDGLMNIRCMQAGGVEAPPAYDEKRLVWNEVKGQP